MHYLSIVFIEWGPTDRSLRLCHTAGSTVCSSVLNQLLYSVALVSTTRHFIAVNFVEVAHLGNLVRWITAVLHSSANISMYLLKTNTTCSVAYWFISANEGSRSRMRSLELTTGNEFWTILKTKFYCTTREWTSWDVESHTQRNFFDEQSSCAMKCWNTMIESFKFEFLFGGFAAEDFCSL